MTLFAPSVNPRSKKESCYHRIVTLIIKNMACSSCGKKKGTRSSNQVVQGPKVVTRSASNRGKGSTKKKPSRVIIKTTRKTYARKLG